MAKAATASAEKPMKRAKKNSQQDLQADASPKSKKTKRIEEGSPPSALDEPSSSKPKKEKKNKGALQEVGKKPMSGMEGPMKAAPKEKTKKDAVKGADHPRPETGEDAPVQAKADGVAGQKRKRKSLAATKESVPEAVPLQAKEAEEPKSEDASEKKKKRKSMAAGEQREDSPEKTKRKRKDVAAEAKSTEVAPDVSPALAASTPAKRKTKSKGGASAPAPAPEPEAEDEDEEEEDEEQPADKADEPEFYGFSSDDDSSDEEMEDEMLGIDITKLPTVAKDDATVQRRLEKAKRKATEDRGVIYLGRIPHGFYEDQMRAYFSQFGTVTRLRLSRNKKTGKSKHYGFVEFDSSSVTQIVADTMDNYLLMGHILTCKLIPKDQVHPQLWVGANRKWRRVPRDRVARVAHNKPRTEEETAKAEARLLKRQEQRKRKLEQAGIKYDFEAVAYKKKPKPTEA